MIARLLISSSIQSRVGEIEKLLSEANLGKNHPDVLYFEETSKLGIEQARIIKQHFSLKPYSAKGRTVALEDASTLTHEAQNALLKTIEELPKEAILILGASSDANLLPTILSRCEIVNLETTSDDTLVYVSEGKESSAYHSKYIKDLERLLDSSIEERFEYIEKLKEKEEFLHSMLYFFRQKMVEPITHARCDLAKLEVTNFLSELLQAEEWAKHNVNIRAILEYLILVMPKYEDKSN